MYVVKTALLDKMRSPPPAVPTVEVPQDRFTLTSCQYFRTVSSSDPSSAIGNLVTKTPEAIDCTSQEGMSAKARGARLESQYNLDKMRTRISNQEWSLLVWFIPAIPSHQNASPVLEPILTLGHAGNTTSDLEPTWGCNGNYLQLAQYNNFLVLAFQDIDVGRSCRFLVLRETPLTETVVAAIVFSATNLSIYLNGKAALSQIPHTINPLHWTEAEASSLQLFSSARAPSSSTSQTFGGSIQQISLVYQSLTPQLIATFTRQDLIPNEPPPIILLAKPSDPVHLTQSSSIDKRSPMFLSSSSMPSTNYFPLAIEILSLPTHGELFLMGALWPLSLNATANILPLANNESGVWLEYKMTSNNYFTLPSTDAYGEDLNIPLESFQFRVVSTTVDNHVRVTPSILSLTAIQTVEVQNVNHKPYWVAPDEATISVIGSLITTKLGRVQLIDVQDMNTNLIRVDVVTEKGLVTLSPEFSGLADFDSCSSRSHTAWQCTENGISKSRMTFLCVPGDVELILSNLEYHGAIPGHADRIILFAYDGEGGDCLAPQEHVKNHGGTYGPVHNGCFEVSTVIQIPAVSLLKDGESGRTSGFFGIPNTDLHNFSYAKLLFWVLLLSFLTCMCLCFRQCCPRCLARGAAIDADDDNDSAEDEAIESSPSTPAAETNTAV